MAGGTKRRRKSPGGYVQIRVQCIVQYESYLVAVMSCHTSCRQQILFVLWYSNVVRYTADANSCVDRTFGTRIDCMHHGGRFMNRVRSAGSWERAFSSRIILLYYLLGFRSPLIIAFMLTLPLFELLDSILSFFQIQSSGC